MVIHYSTKKLEKTLTNLRLIRKEYSQHYNNVINRLSELETANSLENISYLPPPRRHKLNGNLKNCWGIDYSKNMRIVITPIGSYEITNLATIIEIKILCLEDYH